MPPLSSLWSWEVESVVGIYFWALSPAKITKVFWSIISIPLLGKIIEQEVMLLQEVCNTGTHYLEIHHSEKLRVLQPVFTAGHVLSHWSYFQGHQKAHQSGLDTEIALSVGSWCHSTKTFKRHLAILSAFKSWEFPWFHGGKQLGLLAGLGMELSGGIVRYLSSCPLLSLGISACTHSRLSF